MKNLTLENITKACNGTYFGDESLKEREITGVEKDSRLIKEGFLYVPFVGENVDGHDFIGDVFDKGAYVTLSEKELDDCPGPYILVESSGQALKDIAEFYRDQVDCKIVGVTGSVGKTSTKEMLYSVLSEKFNVHKTHGNLNNEIGMPLTLLQIRDEHEIAIVEMGISFFGEMSRLAKVAKPDVCTITNIGACHLENLGDLNGVLKAKTEMFEYAKDDCYVVLNGDDEKLRIVQEVKGNKPIFYGIETKQDVTAVDYVTDGLDGTDIIVDYEGTEVKMRVGLPGKHNVLNALCAICVGKHFGMTFEEMSRGLMKVDEVSGHNDVFESKGLTIINGCYNANPMSMRASLDMLADVDGRKVAVLGDMFELGPDEEKLHREVGEYTATKDLDLIICIGKLAKNINDAITYNVKYYETKEDFMDEMDEILKEGDTVLVKASNGMKFKDIIERLK